MNTQCSHCHILIEIDPETRAALQGHAHFQCPSCEGLVPVPAVTRAPIKVTAAAAIRPSDVQAAVSPLASAHRLLNRNVLILGSAALLVLGGIVFFLASQKSGDKNNTTRNITDDIINNDYFQRLIVSGVTTEEDLRTFELVRPCGNGFWALSEKTLNWREAQQLATHSGAQIFGGGDSATYWPDVHKIVDTEFPQLQATSVWMQNENHAGIRQLGKTETADSQLDHSVDSMHRVLLYWDPSRDISPVSPWLREQIPPPDKEGWISLFDGETLNGCSAELITKAKGKINVQDGVLSVLGRDLRFGIKARNLILRIEAKNIDHGIFYTGWRGVHGSKKFKSFYKDLGPSKLDYVNVGSLIFNPNLRELGFGQTTVPHGEFFIYEVSAVDDQITLSINGASVFSITNNEINEAGNISVTAPKLNHFRKIQVKILD